MATKRKSSKTRDESPAPAKKLAAKKAPAKKSTASKKASTKTAAPAKKPASAKKPAPAKKASTKKAATKKTAPARKATTPKKASTKKAAPAKKHAPAKKAASAAKGSKASGVGGAVGTIVAWMKKHAPGAIRDLGAPASKADLAAVEKAMGGPLPADLVALWSLHAGGLSLFEYEGFGPERALERREGLEELRKKGIFDKHEIFDPSSTRTKPVKWHRGWLPIAQDGGGNLYCVDFDPGPKGVFGQVLRWENQGGPGAGQSLTLGRVLARYAKVLPGFVYDVDAGTFDGPWIDLLAGD